MTTANWYTTADRYTTGDYLAKNPDWHVGDSAWKAAQVLKMVDRHKLDVRTVAEIGCGAGEVLKELWRQMPEGITFSGYELSPDAHTLCQSRTTDRLNYYLTDMLTAGETSDLVLSIDVIEHVEDVYGFLRGLRVKGRHKIFHIPLDLSAYAVMGNTLMKGRRAFGHIHYFTRATALALLEECGYGVIDWFYTFGAIESPGQRGGSLLRRGLRVARQTTKLLLGREAVVRTLGGASMLVLAE